MSTEDQKKAENLFKESGMADNLIKIVLESKHYHAWVLSQDEFNKKWDLGLKNISREEVDVEVNYNTKIKYLTKATHQETNIKFGNQRYSINGEDDYLTYEAVLFYINNQLVINAKYTVNDDGYIPQNYYFSNLEEFHYSKELENILIDINKDIETQKANIKQLEKIQEENKYKGKFTFE
jgi:hypothetical protein